MQIVVLGSAAPYPAPENPCSGYLVTDGETRIWVDAGPGTLAELRRYCELDRLDAIWISHMHADHSSDLLAAYYGVLYAGLRLTAPIPLYGPPGTADRLANFLTNGESRSHVESAFDFRELHDGHQTTVGSLRLTSAAVVHDAPGFAVRIENDGTSLTYSGDTSPCPALTALAVDCDLLLCEADSPDPGPDHHTPEDAGRTASEARARRLVVTHVGPRLSPAAAISRAAAHYDGDITHATPGRAIPVG